MLYAPYADNLESKVPQEIKSFHTDILELIDQAANQSKLEFKDLEIERPDLPDFKPFRPEDHNVVLEWDPNTLSILSKYIHHLTVNIFSALKKIDGVIQHRSGMFSFKGLWSYLTFKNLWLHRDIGDHKSAKSRSIYIRIKLRYHDIQTIYELLDR